MDKERIECSSGGCSLDDPGVKNIQKPEVGHCEEDLP